MKELRAGPEFVAQKTARDYNSRDDQGSVQTEHFDGGFMLLPLQQPNDCAKAFAFMTGPRTL
jgi:hypothetical protein